MRSLHAVGNGEVEVYELIIPPDWGGRRIMDLLPDHGAIVVALSRNGRGLLPVADTVLQADDLLYVSATDPASALLRRRLHQENGA
jgi:trk system potassium uptake protein TrkA